MAEKCNSLVPPLTEIAWLIFPKGLFPKSFLYYSRFPTAVEVFDQGCLSLGGLYSTIEEPHQP